MTRIHKSQIDLNDSNVVPLHVWRFTTCVATVT